MTGSVPGGDHTGLLHGDCQNQLIQELEIFIGDLHLTDAHTEGGIIFPHAVKFRADHLAESLDGLLVWRENVYNPVDRIGGTGGMDGTENDMTRLCSRESELDRL